MEGTAWTGSPLWTPVTCVGLGESGPTSRLSPCPAPCRCFSPCAPPRLGRPVLDPRRCVAAAPPLNAPCPALCPLCKACLCCPGTSSAAVSSWMRRRVVDVGAERPEKLEGKIPLYGSRRARAGRAMVDPDAPGTGTGWSRGCSVEEGSLHEREMPRAEPSADCWDWPFCTRGQRSSGRGLGNLTRRDWSLPGRHRCDVDVS